MKRVRRHPKYPDRDILGRRLKGCRSPNPAAYKKTTEPQPTEAPAPVQDTTIDAQLVSVVNVRRYINSLRQAVERGEIQAADRYERALLRQAEVKAQALDYSRLDDEQLALLGTLVSIAAGQQVPQQDLRRDLLALLLATVTPKLRGTPLAYRLGQLLPRLQKFLDGEVVTGSLDMLTESEQSVLQVLNGKREDQGIGSPEEFVRSLLKVTIEVLIPGIGPRDLAAVLTGLEPMVRRAVLGEPEKKASKRKAPKVPNKVVPISQEVTIQ